MVSLLYIRTGEQRIGENKPWNNLMIYKQFFSCLVRCLIHYIDTFKLFILHGYHHIHVPVLYKLIIYITPKSFLYTWVYTILDYLNKTHMSLCHDEASVRPSIRQLFPLNYFFSRTELQGSTPNLAQMFLMGSKPSVVTFMSI